MLPPLLFYVGLSTGQQGAPKVVSLKAKPSSPKSCSQLPFQENFVDPCSIHNTKVMNKAIHVLVDTGASHSVIAMKWLKYLKLNHLIVHTNKCLAIAQNIKFSIQEKVIIPVEFGRKTFD